MSVTTERPMSKTDRRCDTWAIPLTSVSLGPLTRCSTSWAACPGHCVITCTQVSATSGYASIGSRWKATTPQARRSTPTNRTRTRWCSAQSTIRRIIASGAGCRADERQRVEGDLVARREAGEDLLRAVGQHPTRLDLRAPEAARPLDPEDPAPILEAEHRGGRRHDVRGDDLRLEAGRGEHPRAQEPLRVVELDAHLRRARRGIEHARDVPDRTGERN